MALSIKSKLARSASGESLLPFDPTGKDEQRLADLPIASIERDPDQPRKDLGDVSELAASIQEQGLLQPIVVTALDSKTYRVLAGERRLAACKKLERPTIQCIIRTVEEHQRLALQIIENLHRKDLNPVEEARSFKRLMEEFKLDQRDLAKRLGKSLGAINQTLRILSLSEALLNDVQTSEHVSKSVLLEIAKESDPDKQAKLLEDARAGELTVKKARQAKAKPSKPKSGRTVHSIKVEGAVVSIRFQKKNVSAEERIAALEEALQIEKKG